MMGLGLIERTCSTYERQNKANVAANDKVAAAIDVRVRSTDSVVQSTRFAACRTLRVTRSSFRVSASIMAKDGGDVTYELSYSQWAACNSSG